MNKEPTILPNNAIKLLRTIGSPFLSTTDTSEEDNESLELYDYAVKNKIPLLYLECLKQQGKLNEQRTKYEEECARYLNFLNGVAKVSKILNNANIEYAVFKTIKPFHTVPGDVDILLLGDEKMYKKAFEVLLRKGYIPQLPDLLDATALKSDEDFNNAVKILTRPISRKGGISPTGTDLIDPEWNTDIDMQRELALNHVIYMDKNNFRGYITETELLSGDRIKVPTPELDMAIVIAHSIVEQLYLLGEFYTFLYRLSEMSDGEIGNFLNILKENKLTMAAKSFVTITAVLCKEAYGKVPEKVEGLLDELGYEESEAKRLVTRGFKVPHRYSGRTLTKVFLEKTKEKRFRRSVGVQMVKMLNPKLMRLVIGEIIEMRRREYYLKEVE